MGPPWRIDPTTHRTMSECSYHGATSHSQDLQGRSQPRVQRDNVYGKGATSRSQDLQGRSQPRVQRGNFYGKGVTSRSRWWKIDLQPINHQADTVYRSLCLDKWLTGVYTHSRLNRLGWWGGFHARVPHAGHAVATHSRVEHGRYGIMTRNAVGEHRHHHRCILSKQTTVVIALLLFLFYF